MIHLPEKFQRASFRNSRGTARNRAAFVLCLTLAVPLLCATRIAAQTVATYGFEDGTADGWGSFFNASTPVASIAAAESGSFSLLTSTSVSGTGGPSISLNSVLLPGAKYTITGYVYKSVVEILMTPITYKVVAWLKSSEGLDVVDVDTDFNPFTLG